MEDSLASKDASPLARHQAADGSSVLATPSVVVRQSPLARLGVNGPLLILGFPVWGVEVQGLHDRAHITVPTGTWLDVS